MSKNKIVLYSLLHALGLLAYVVGVVLLLETISTITSGIDGPMAGVPFLLLLVFSVAVVGIIIFGRPIYLFLSGMKIEAVKFLAYTMAWILIFLILAFSGTILFTEKFHTKELVEGHATIQE